MIGDIEIKRAFDKLKFNGSPSMFPVLPLLSDEEAVELFTKFKESGDYASREKLILHNVRMVLELARRYSGMGVDFEDLVQEGLRGLIESVDKFDCGRAKFSTFAYWWIRQKVRRALDEQSRVIRLPGWFVQEGLIMFRKRREFIHKNDREPSDDELLELTGYDLGKINHINLCMNRTLSLDEPITEEGDVTVGDMVVDETSGFDFDSLFTAPEYSQIEEVMKELGEKERSVLISRYGLNGSPVVSLRDLAEKLDLSPEGVRFVEKRAIWKIRKALGVKMKEGTWKLAD